MRTSDFNYDLPEELIAQTPTERRDASRLLRLDKCSGAIAHGHFPDVLGYLNEGDCLVLNNSRVLPARLIGRRETGGAAELLLLRDLGELEWECLVKPGKKLREGATVDFGDGSLRAEIKATMPGGNRRVKFYCDGIFLEVLERLGTMPLPPYITEKLSDSERYQTVYSKETGSAAAPTAGLHFTKEMLSTLQSRGVKLCYVTLHVGLGTFRPVKVEDVHSHEMHSELCTVDEKAAEMINNTREEGGKVVCVGTTSCRTVESFADESGRVQAGTKDTSIFIYPGYKFKCTDALLTNFHLPESTLIMLISALAGRDQILAAYEEAVRERYRFFSFGDAMLII